MFFVTNFNAVVWQAIKCTNLGIETRFSFNKFSAVSSTNQDRRVFRNKEASLPFMLKNSGKIFYHKNLRSFLTP
jgi:hypothetical protein